MASDDNDEMSAYERDKIQKQSLVLSTIISHCSATSPFEEIRTIASALKSGNAKLSIENLTGGYTNYTYKVKLVPSDEEAINDEVSSTALFVKLCFQRCFWNPDPEYPYDVQRIAHEYEMLQKFAKLAPGCVATPYFLLDIGDMKLLATEWASTDEQAANQFIEGAVDLRVVKGLASAIASLHCSKFDPEFNTEARECMISVFSRMEDKLRMMAKGEVNGTSIRAAKLAKKIGPETCSAIFRCAEEGYRSQDILIHTDLHMFNILVESKPDTNQLDVFGEKGSFCICDWEMCMAGPPGLDMGRLYSIPVACILAHAISGNSGVEDGIMKWLNLYWEEYSSAMKRIGKKDEDFLCKSYLNAMAWLGWKLFAMYTFDWFIPFLPVEPGSVDAFRESLGVVSITLLQYGFGGNDDTLTLDELQLRFNTTISDEVSLIKSLVSSEPRRRRSSILRETNRRVSDAFQEMGQGLLKNVIHEISEVDNDC